MVLPPERDLLGSSSGPEVCRVPADADIDAAGLSGDEGSGRALLVAFGRGLKACGAVGTYRKWLNGRGSLRCKVKTPTMVPSRTRGTPRLARTLTEFCWRSCTRERLYSGSARTSGTWIVRPSRIARPKVDPRSGRAKRSPHRARRMGLGKPFGGTFEQQPLFEFSRHGLGTHECIRAKSAVFAE